MRLIFLMPALIFFADAPAMADPSTEGFRKLNALEIRRAFAGRTFSDDVHFSFWYAPDGRVEGTGMGVKVTNRWRTDRDELCVTDANGESCYGVWKKGGAVKLIIGDQDISLDGDLH